MSLKDLDLVKLSKLTSQQIDHVTCLECCKYFIAPATAACGHTLCHSCWRGRRTCPACATHLERKTLKLNIPLQTLTDHIQVLGEAFEKLFNIKLDEFNLDTPGEVESEKDPDKNVKDWLTSSQNHFSAPIQNSDTFSQDIQQPSNPLEVSASNILIHTNTKKVTSPPKVIHVPPPQDDWDKIEAMPEPETLNKKQENIVGPMDIEPFFIDDCEYTTNNPRRSSRKRDLKNEDSLTKKNDLSSNMHSSRESSGDNEKKSQKNKQNWNNVKKMRKEFSKLNKKNRSKLNVSIEMVKKTQNLKPTINTPTASEQIYNIDDNTPDINNKENEGYNINPTEPTEDKPIESEKHLSTIYGEKENKDNRSMRSSIQESPDNVIPKDSVGNNKYSIKTANKEIGTTNQPENSTKNSNNAHEISKMPFFKKSALNPVNTLNPDQIPNLNSVQPMTTDNSDDIEISIKIGTTITNILIKKKLSDVQVKINTDREVQTSLGPHNLAKSNTSLLKDTNTHNIDINIESKSAKDQEPVLIMNTIKNIQVADTNLNKTTSEKKNTASADTATAQFEITESVEKELSNIMECEEEKANSTKNFVTKPPQVEMLKADKIVEQHEDIDDLNDLDIFNSGSVKETNVQVLKNPAPSEILVSTVQNKFRTQKVVEKRDRDNNDEELLPKKKKIKMTIDESPKALAAGKGNVTQHDSEPINYDAIMGQVFASIDADIEDIRKSQDVESVTILKNIEQPTSKTNISSQMQKTLVIKKFGSQMNEEITPNLNEYFNEKHSENVFSILEKEDDNSEILKADNAPQQEDELLTPVVRRNLNSTQKSRDGSDLINKTNKKTHEDDDSDKSVVEETPQKSSSLPKLKRANTSNQLQITSTETKNMSRKSTSTVKSIINLTDTVSESTNKTNRDVTVIETAAQKPVLETPLTITKFADQIKHKSTPMARKSLNFDHENDDNDPEQTLCPTSEAIAKTTQEKEFMCKAFEMTPTTPAVKPLSLRYGSNTNKKYCLAGSCLTSTEIAKVKILCNERKWSYVDKYIKDLTHLIVGVDEEHKSQRSVKYMCALAASKWIVSFEWIKKCLQTKEIVNEEYFEALDSTGEPGPKRSRIAKQKLFAGITFYCMPPFSVLDVDTLKNMLLAAGGRVVNEAKDVRITADVYQPALLLAEPENTQEDRFIYLAMEQSIVPVNYEWVLNCLGNYTLGSVQELLLCPSSLLPAATAKWPEVLLAQDYD